MDPDSLAWGYARLDRLRTFDPKRFNVPEKLPPPLTFLFGSWLEALRTASWLEQRGGTVAAIIADPRGGHGALMRDPALMRQALDLFQGR